MKIAITADPELPVPPKLYGGIERVIAMLIEGLVDRGHQVTLFANHASKVPCELVPFKGASSLSRVDTVRNMLTVSQRVISGGFDIVHSFGRIAYLLPMLPLSIPKLMTYQREITHRSIIWGHRLSRGTLHFSAISRDMMKCVEGTANWHLVYNGVPIRSYDFSPVVSADAPLVFLGRIEYIKGPHLAIEIAKRSGRRLVIAGNVPPDHQTYFNDCIAPHLDGTQVSYIGPVDDAQKNVLLGSAAAFLMPILWEEPFGIVMAEAMACGTPVLGLRRGAVPEVVQHGISGFTGDTIDDLVTGVAQIADLDRRTVRKLAEDRFGDSVIVADYERLYQAMLTPVNSNRARRGTN